NRIRCVREAHVLESFPWIRPLEHPAILRNCAEPAHQARPDIGVVVVGDLRQLVAGLPAHLGARRYREHRLRRYRAELEHALHRRRQLRLRRCNEVTVAIGLDTSIPEHVPQLRQIEHRRRVARYEDAVGVRTVGAESRSTRADGETPSISRSVRCHVTGGAADVMVPAQYRIEHERLSELRERRSYMRRIGQPPNPARGGELAHEPRRQRSIGRTTAIALSGGGDARRVGWLLVGAAEEYENDSRDRDSCPTRSVTHHFLVLRLQSGEMRKSRLGWFETSCLNHQLCKKWCDRPGTHREPRNHIIGIRPPNPPRSGREVFGTCPEARRIPYFAKSPRMGDRRWAPSIAIAGNFSNRFSIALWI